MPEIFDRLRRTGSTLADQYSQFSFDNPANPLRPLKQLVALDALVGNKLAGSVLNNQRIGPVNIESLMSEILRPSNLIPASRATSLLKARTFGPALYRELAKEGAFSGLFSVGETLRRGGSGTEAALSGGLGFGFGAATPFAFEAGRWGVNKLRRG
jgi:hypothetical protein